MRLREDRLAGAVVAAEGGDLTGRQVEVDPEEGLDRAEVLADAAQPQERLGAGRGVRDRGLPGGGAGGGLGRSSHHIHRAVLRLAEPGAPDAIMTPAALPHTARIRPCRTRSRRVRHAGVASDLALWVADPRSAAWRQRLLDAGRRADVSADGCADIGCLDELVGDDRGFHVRRVDPDGGQQDGRLGRGRVGRDRWWCRSAGPPAGSGRPAGRWRARRPPGPRGRSACRPSRTASPGARTPGPGRWRPGRSSGTVLAALPAFFRSVMTAPARPSLASIVALISGWAVRACWKMVPPLALSQPGASCSPTRVAPPLVLVAPAVAWATSWPHTASL